jgi:hypothetical protein
MSRNGLRLIQLLQILLLFLRQRLTPNLNRLINPLNTTKPNNRTADPLIDPCQCDLTHLPALLLSQFLNASNGLVIGISQSLVCFGLAANCGSECFGGTSEETAAERCPLFFVSRSFFPNRRNYLLESIQHQCLCRIYSSPSPPHDTTGCIDSAY